MAVAIANIFLQMSMMNASMVFTTVEKTLASIPRDLTAVTVLITQTTNHTMVLAVMVGLCLCVCVGVWVCGWDCGTVGVCVCVATCFIVDCTRQAKLLVSRRHAFFTKICVSPAGRVCVYSSLILSTFFLLFSAPV